MQQSLFIRFLANSIAFIVRILVRSRYKIKVLGTEVLKSDKTSFIMPNHMALVDPVILLSHIYSYTAATPVISEKFYDLPVARTFFRKLGAVRVSDLESGSRDTQVLKVITRSVLKGLKRKNSVLLYPSGQIAGQGYEKIFNKKSAFHIVSKLPDDVQVVGVRITGLWGSMFSKARSGKSPDFFLQLLKGLLMVLANLLFFVPKRTVVIEFEDITDQAKEAAIEGQKSFNLFLEGFYNLHGEEAPNYLKHYFFLPN